jgi:hypothetical protein
MKKDLFFAIVFTIIVTFNLKLAIWNTLQGDYYEALVSSIIVVLVIVWFFIDRRKR